MEQVLGLYEKSYNAEYPVVCFDERPCVLHGEIIDPLPLQTGRVYKEHYAYERNGSCALLAAIEPLTGKRIAEVYFQRTKKEYTLFCQKLAKSFSKAIKIRLVQDNLNTHNASSFYENLPPEEAYALAQRFEFYYTPKSASWLNMIEIEFSALTRQCLERRIPSIDKLRLEVLSLIKKRAQKKIKIKWQFSLQKARSKMCSCYEKIKSTM